MQPFLTRYNKLKRIKNCSSNLKSYTAYRLGKQSWSSYNKCFNRISKYEKLTSIPDVSKRTLHKEQFSFSVFCVSDGITKNTSSESQMTNSGHINSLVIITKDSAMTLSASLSKSFSSFTASWHFVLLYYCKLFNDLMKLVL